MASQATSDPTNPSSDATSERAEDTAQPTPGDETAQTLSQSVLPSSETAGADTGAEDEGTGDAPRALNVRGMAAAFDGQKDGRGLSTSSEVRWEDPRGVREMFSFWKQREVAYAEQRRRRDKAAAAVRRGTVRRWRRVNDDWEEAPGGEQSKGAGDEAQAAATRSEGADEKTAPAEESCTTAKGEEKATGGTEASEKAQEKEAEEVTAGGAEDREEETQPLSEGKKKKKTSKKKGHSKVQGQKTKKKRKSHARKSTAKAVRDVAAEPADEPSTVPSEDSTKEKEAKTNETTEAETEQEQLPKADDENTKEHAQKKEEEEEQKAQEVEDETKKEEEDSVKTETQEENEVDEKDTSEAKLTESTEQDERSTAESEAAASSPVVDVADVPSDAGTVSTGEASAPSSPQVVHRCNSADPDMLPKHGKNKQPGTHGRFGSFVGKLKHTPAKSSLPGSSGLSAAADDAVRSGGSTGVLNDDWKNKRAWATMTQTRLHKPLAEMTVEEMRESRRRYEDELVFTEEDYVKKLQTVVKLFYNPLMTLSKDPNAEHAIITGKDIMVIFSNLPILLKYNEVLLQKMQAWHDNGVGEIGKIFLGICDFLKIYIMYINNYAKASTHLTELMTRNSKLAQFVARSCSDPECENLDLLSLLIMPVQRIPRYVLLIKALIEHTHKDDPDLANLELALQKMMGVADDINAKKRDAENMQQVLLVQGKLDMENHASLCAVPSRRYVREGELFELTEKGAKGAYFFLFNDIVVCASLPKHLKQQQKVRAIIELEGATLDLFRLDSDAHPVPCFTGKKRRITLSARNGASAELDADSSSALFLAPPRDAAAAAAAASAPATPTALVLAGISDDETQQWHAAIKQCMDDIAQRKAHLENVKQMFDSPRAPARHLSASAPCSPPSVHHVQLRSELATTSHTVTDSAQDEDRPKEKTKSKGKGKSKSKSKDSKKRERLKDPATLTTP